MDQGCPDLFGGQRQVSDRYGVDRKGALGGILALIDPMISGGVQDQGGPILVKDILDLSPVGQFEIGMRQRNQLMVAECPQQLASQLPIGADQERRHGRPQCPVPE